uniref:Uncharacterized protein n=1 Tax=Sinocyclocheilus grahami TaxID=75366 RepID=A0A672KTT2_SINGR
LVKQVISGSDTKSRHPCVFVLLPLYVATVLGAGFIFLQEREANDIEDQFTPVNGPAKLERAIVLENFPQSEEFSQLRLASDGTYASLIITGLNGKNILTEEIMNPTHVHLISCLVIICCNYFFTVLQHNPYKISILQVNFIMYT